MNGPNLQRLEVKDNPGEFEHDGRWVRWDTPPDEPYPTNVQIGEASGFRIATIWDTPRGDVEAKTRLILAAPDLLAACKSAALLLPMCSCDNGVYSPRSGQSEGEFWLKTLRDQIDIAIAKAT